MSKKRAMGANPLMKKAKEETAPKTRNIAVHPLFAGENTDLKQPIHEIDLYKLTTPETKKRFILHYYDTNEILKDSRGGDRKSELAKHTTHKKSQTLPERIQQDTQGLIPTGTAKRLLAEIRKQLRKEKINKILLNEENQAYEQIKQNLEKNRKLIERHKGLRRKVAGIYADEIIEIRNTKNP